MMVYATPEKVLISREEIAEKVAETAAKLADEYRGKKPLVVCVLNGAAIFFADLIRGMDIPLEVSSVAATSYGDSTESSGEVRITKDIDVDIKGRHVLLVEDIIDSGRTMKALTERLKQYAPASLAVCAFADKPSRRVNDFKADYVCFEVPNRFVVGYGLDCAGLYRNLPDLRIIGDTQ